MTEYVRVRWKATGHQSSLAESRVDSERHVVLKRPATDGRGDPLPPKYKSSVVTPASESKADDNGHEANTEGENHG